MVDRIMRGAGEEVNQVDPRTTPGSLGADLIRAQHVVVSSLLPRSFRAKSRNSRVRFAKCFSTTLETNGSK